MQQQAAVKIDREIGGTNAHMPEPTETKVSAEPQSENTTETVFEPYKPKIKKEWDGLHYQDQRPPLRRTIYANQRRWQTHLQECLCKDTRRMRGKAGGADCGNEG